MEDRNIEPYKESTSTHKSFKKNILAYDDNDKQTLFKFFGIELTAPKELKNPRLVYLSFILVNIILLLIIKNLTIN